MSKVKENLKGTESTPEQKEEMYQKWKNNATLVDLAEEFNKDRSTISGYKTKMKWQERKDEEESKALALVPYIQKLEKIEPTEVRDLTIKDAEVVLNLAIRRYKEEMLNEEGGTAGIINAIHKISSALEKFQGIEIKKKTGGKNISEVHVKKEVIEWDKIIRLSLEAKKKHGDDFDESKFLKEAINTSVKKDD